MSQSLVCGIKGLGEDLEVQNVLNAWIVSSIVSNSCATSEEGITADFLCNCSKSAPRSFRS